MQNSLQHLSSFKSIKLFVPALLTTLTTSSNDSLLQSKLWKIGIAIKINGFNQSIKIDCKIHQSLITKLIYGMTSIILKCNLIVVVSLCHNLYSIKGRNTYLLIQLILNRSSHVNCLIVLILGGKQLLCCLQVCFFSHNRFAAL